jgi:(4-(4-[2-(gamma-L-glutamylamino)ethyl]phenoxymethyl)furan-2-yl)methanamine synthase
MAYSNFTGWDIGGAHLKVAAVEQSGKLNYVEQFALPIWEGVDQLENLMPKVFDKLPNGSCSHAFTITAELSDIFKDRNSGVKTLIDVCEKKLGQDVFAYSVDSGLLNLESARNKMNQLASANWHASASYTASLYNSGLFVDVGSTTTDIVSFNDNKLNNKGHNDQTRLRFDELVYTGVIRTPLMALTNKVPFKGVCQNIAAENFATTADVYRILGCLYEEDDLMAAADGKEKDMNGSFMRLARMLGADFINSDDVQPWRELAEFFQESQLQLLTNAILRVRSNSINSNEKIIGAGVGSFLVKKIAQRLNAPYIDFSELCESETDLQHKCNVCAPAVAVAQLNRRNYIS